MATGARLSAQKKRIRTRAPPRKRARTILFLLLLLLSRLLCFMLYLLLVLFYVFGLSVFERACAICLTGGKLKSV